MTISLELVVLILVGHWMADFIGQTDQMAKNKSTSNAYHVIVYGLIMLSFIGVTTRSIPWEWVAVNTLAHGATDYVTSRVSSRLWRAGEVHWFFVVVGFDQMIHFITLFVTAAYML
jgi:hypothetical protein